MKQRNGRVFPGCHGVSPATHAGSGPTVPVHDAREEIAARSIRSRTAASEIDAFLRSKRELVASNAQMSDAARERALLRIDARRAQVADTASGEGDGEEEEEEPGEPPVPGGVGMGVIYNDDFRADFGTGTAAEFYIICPRQPAASQRGCI